jgi:hypothetical protein
MKEGTLALGGIPNSDSIFDGQLHVPTDLASRKSQRRFGIRLLGNHRADTNFVAEIKSLLLKIEPWMSDP